MGQGEATARDRGPLWRKRKAIELGHFEARLTRGRGSFHFENLTSLTSALTTALRLTGLRARGERNALRAVVRPIRFVFDSLPEAFHGFRMLHLSDLHIDGLAGLAESLCERLQDIEVDLCVLTGDYRFAVHGPCHNVYYHMEKVLAAVRARCGIVGVLGNHDFAEEADALERMGVRMLMNEAQEVREGPDSVWVVGLDDAHYYGCDDLPGALTHVPADAFKILLVHSPEIINEAERAGMSLYLCGHTHAGQICLPGLGPVFTNASCPRKYTYGTWCYGGIQGYTSAGAGSSGVPVRFFCPPEIGLIELRCSHLHDTEKG